MRRVILLVCLLLGASARADEAVPLGSTQLVVVCVAGSSGVQGPCGSGQVQSVVTGYVVSSTEATRFELAVQPFDAAKAGEFFAFGLITTMGFWALAWGCGQVLSMI